MPLLVRKTRDCFALTLGEVIELFSDAPREAVASAFRLLDQPEKGLVAACEGLGVLLLLAPQLSVEVKLQGALVICFRWPPCWSLESKAVEAGVFHMFNASTHRRGELVADEATLLFRSLAVGLLKVVATSYDALPALSVFEDLTKTMYADKETLTLQEFVRACQSTQPVASVADAWLRPPAASDAIENAAQSWQPCIGAMLHCVE